MSNPSPYPYLQRRRAMAGQPVPEDTHPLVRPCEGKPLPAGARRAPPANDPRWNVRVTFYDVFLNGSVVTAGFSVWAVIALVFLVAARKVWP